MSIEAIAAVGLDAVGAVAPPASIVKAAPTAFETMLDSVEQLNESMRVNDRAIQQVALGETDNLHQVMMNMERTRLEFNLLLQVRNKAMEAYQELMRMQV